MAKKDTSFSMQLSDIPVPGNTGEAMGYIAKSGESQAGAGRSAGAAKAMGTNLTAGAIGTVFNTARDAYIGYESAKIEEASEEAIAKFEDSPQNVEGRKAYEAVQAAEAKGVPLPPELLGLQEKAAKYKRAMEQGFITQDEAINRMAAAVKKASARSPGLQSEFRKVAANVSGINAVDIYRDHKALTTESAREKAELARLKAEQKYIGDVSEYFGIPPSQVTEHHAQRYAAAKALKNETENAEAVVKLKNISADERGEAFSQVGRTYIAADMNTLSVDLVEWNKLNNDLSPEAAKAKDALRANMAVKVEQLKLQRKNQLLQLAAEGKIPQKSVDAQIKAIDDHYGQVVKMIGDDKFDLLKNTLGRAEDGVKSMEAKFATAFPIFTMMKKAGISETVMTNLFTPAGMANVNNIMGKGFAEGVKESLKDLPGWAERQTQYYDPETYKREGPVDIGATRGTPEAKKTDMQTAIGNVGMLATKPVSKWDDEDRSSAQRYAGTIGKTMKSQLVKAPENSKYLLDQMDKAAPRLIEAMTEEQRKEVGTHFTESGEGFLKDQIYGVQTTFNDLKNLDNLKTTKVKVEVVPGKGLQLVMEQARGTTPTPYVVYDGGLFSPGRRETHNLAPVSQSELLSNTVEQQSNQVRRALTKVNLAIRAAALGNRFKGEGMDIDQYAQMVASQLNGVPSAVVAEEKPSGK